MSDNKVETELLSQIKEVLLKFPKYWEKDVLLRNKVAEDLRNYNQELIEALLSNKLVKDTYSITLDSTNIFKIEEFISMLRYKNYWENSYTKYSNEIGLTSEGKYLNYNTDVVLDFPHKDSILEGGMTKEDVGKKEVYYHNILAREEIDTLLSPKVFTNIKKYDKNGEHDITEFTGKDNLIIRGNNLVAISSLLKRYEGQVKCIYIDPPYNTGGDSFKYNDKFNHSTWLTFMKNRLEIARDLLSNDGSIWINIDDDESHYLKVLCDDIFGRNNFNANIIWKKKYSPQNDARYFSDMHDHILVFSKNKENFLINGLPRTEEMDSRYTNFDNDDRGPWKSSDFSVRRVTPKDQYEIITPGGRSVYPPEGRSWNTSEENFKKLVEDNRIWFGNDGNNVPSVKKFISEVKQSVTPQTIWDYSEVGHNQEAVQNLNKIFNESVFDTPKPEKLLQRIIHIGSNENDIVLDFFMGSATTQAVAMKMNRQFIGVEQMDYINTVSVPRLQKVIEGEQGGISKDVDWKGGGSFVYAELASLNERYVKDIQQASNEAELEKVLSTMKESAYLNFKVDLERVSSKDKGYNALSLEEKKEVLIQVLDMNQLYLSYSEIEDEQYKIPEDVKAFNHSFYQKEGVQDE